MKLAIGQRWLYSFDLSQFYIAEMEKITDSVEVRVKVIIQKGYRSAGELYYSGGLKDIKDHNNDNFFASKWTLLPNQDKL